MRRASTAFALSSSVRLCSSSSSTPPASPAPPIAKAAAPADAKAPSTSKLDPFVLVDRKTHGFGGGAETDFAKVKGSIDFFMKPDSEKPKKDSMPKPGDPLPCDVPNSEAQIFATKVGAMPKPKPKPKPASGAAAQGNPAASAQAAKPIQRSSLPKTDARPFEPSKAAAATPAAATPAAEPAELAADKEAYYASITSGVEMPSKEQLWATMQERRDKAATEGNPNYMDQPGDESASEADYIRVDEEMQAHDFMRYRMSSYFFRDEVLRRKWLSMWNLTMSLNKARWQYYEICNDKGTKTAGGAMRTLFWREAVFEILEKGQMARGQFVDGHPVLRPFAATIQTTPGLTKTFIRGWVDARLKAQLQPANMKNLCDYFDKFYGFYFNTLLEVIGVKNDATEHMMMHIGRAVGISLHCVMFWKKYAALNMTLLPADVCADRHISMALLKKTGLASRDKALRVVLQEMMSVVKTEMIHAHELAAKVPMEAFPVVWECLYPNYYLGFLQRFNFDVSAMLADHNIQNPMWWWYCFKKQNEWGRKHSIADLLSEPAPLPYTNICIGHRGSLYKMPGEAAQRSIDNPSPNQRKKV